MIRLYGQTAAVCIAIMHKQRLGTTVRQICAAGSTMCWYKKIKVIVTFGILLFSVLQPGQLRGTDCSSALCSCHIQAALDCHYERKHHHFPSKWDFKGFSCLSPFSDRINVLSNLPEMKICKWFADPQISFCMPVYLCCSCWVENGINQQSENQSWIQTI